MCKFKTRDGNTCKLSPLMLACHLHKEKLIIQKDNYLKDEIKNLNKTILKKNENIKELNENILTLENKIIQMTEYYDNYQIIVDYENLKNKLSKLCKTNRIHEIVYDDGDLKENIYKEFNKHPILVFNEFKELKLKRNKLCHLHPKKI